MPEPFNTPQCPTGKQPYVTAADAWKVIRLITGKNAFLTHKKPGKKGCAYQCTQCHQWHLTSRQGLDIPADWHTRKAHAEKH